jgi:magnesium transporter
MNLDLLNENIDNKKWAEVKKMISDMNEFDIAEIINDLPIEKAVKVFRLLSKDHASDVFVNLDTEVEQSLITALTDKETKMLIEDMFTDDAADLFDEMPAMMVNQILAKVDKDTRNDINRLLKYPDNSAGSLMAVEYIRFTEGMTISEAIKDIRRQKDDFVSYESCFITDKERHLLGRISIKELIINDPNDKIDDIMDPCEHTIFTLMDQEEVAKYFQDYDYSTLPVVDSENRLVGIITIDDVVDIMEAEATEDIEKMAAIVPGEKSYDKTTVFETFKARIPWLLLLMVSATFTGKIIQSFEAQLAAYTILTAFIPMLMDSGGNAGGQASVSIIRALSLKDIEFKDIFKVMWKEFRVAILCAIVLALCNFAKMMLIDGTKPILALTVCSTLCVTIIIAKLIGCTLPMFAKKIGFDPAVMASPFITTLVDATSLLIYFNFARLILGI